jgi:hypothetical protein
MVFLGFFDLYFVTPLCPQTTYGSCPTDPNLPYEIVFWSGLVLLAVGVFLIGLPHRMSKPTKIARPVFTSRRKSNQD